MTMNNRVNVMRLIMLAFADRYVGLLYSACDMLKKDNPDPMQRRDAQLLLIDGASNMYDIASNAESFTRLLDMVVTSILLSRKLSARGMEPSSHR